MLRDLLSIRKRRIFTQAQNYVTPRNGIFSLPRVQELLAIENIPHQGLWPMVIAYIINALPCLVAIYLVVGSQAIIYCVCVCVIFIFFIINIFILFYLVLE